MPQTKEKIIESAVGLFNKNGLTNVRLQHIADDAGISVGNLAYHFPSKKAIVQRIDRELEKVIMPILSPKQPFAYLIDFDNQLSAYYFLLKQYAFYFLDLLEMERAYPKLHAKRKDYILQMISQINDWMLQHIEKEILKPELQEGHYRQVAHTIWMIITFWLTQEAVRGEALQTEGAFKEAVWSQFLPLFTDAGQLEYNAIILPQLKYFSNEDLSEDYGEILHSKR